MPRAARFLPARMLGLAVGAGVLLLLAGCGSRDVDPAQVDALAAPAVGGCRVLTPDDVESTTNATRTVPCTEPHTAETFAVGQFPDKFARVDYDDEETAAWATDTCSRKLQQFLGADESLMMRTVLTPAWFGPSEKAWKEGARWYRCDVIGGGQQSKSFIDLPEGSARKLLSDQPEDRWLVCAVGETISGAVKVPCSQAHDWRAVSTIKLGVPGDPYPGDKVVQQRTREFCSKQVEAYLSYPIDYDMGFTWFPEPQWDAGNRRSVCWARTDE